MTAVTSTTVDELRDVAVDVVRAVNAHGGAMGGEDNGEGRHSTSERGGVVRYAEVVVTLPASAGVSLPPDQIESVMADVVAAVEKAGAARGKAIVLLNPAEIAARVTVSCLVCAASPGSAAAPDDSPFEPRVALAAAGLATGGDVTCRRVEPADVRTLLGSDSGHRASDSGQHASGMGDAPADPIWRIDAVWEAGESASEPSEGDRR